MKIICHINHFLTIRIRSAIKQPNRLAVRAKSHSPCTIAVKRKIRMAAPDEKEQVYEVSEELQKTLEDIHKQWNDEEEVLEAFRDVLDKKKYIYESNGRWA